MEIGATLTALRSQVRARGYDGLADATVDAAINDAQSRLLGARRWDFMAANTTLALAVGVESVTLPVANARKVDGVVLALTATDRVPLTHLTRQQFYAFHANEVPSGEPEYWSTEGSTILIHPTTTVAATLEVRYHTSAPALVAGEDVSPVPLSYTHVLVAAACLTLAIRQRDANASALHEQAFQSGLREMRDFYVLTPQNSSAVVESGFYE